MICLILISFNNFLCTSHGEEKEQLDQIKEKLTLIRENHSAKKFFSEFEQELYKLEELVKHFDNIQPKSTTKSAYSSHIVDNFTVEAFKENKDPLPKLLTVIILFESDIVAYEIEQAKITRSMSLRHH